MDNSENTKRVAKNTFFLFLRMIIVMCVGLYTSRIVLKTLGIEDYGVYNVIGRHCPKFCVNGNRIQL